MNLPPILSALLSITKRWHFYAITLGLILLGVAIEQASPQQQALICDAYTNNIATRLEEKLNARLVLGDETQAATAPAAATAPSATTDKSAIDRQWMQQTLLGAVHDYFCPLHNPVDTSTFLDRLPRDLARTIPGALILGFLLTGLLPVANKREAIAKRFEAVAQLADERGNATPPSLKSLEDIGKIYPDIAVTARQMRIALLYALLSGLGTLFFPPVFVLAGQPDPGFSAYLPHLSVIAATAIGAALYGTWGFSRTPLSNLKLGVRLGFAPIMFSGFIVSAISIPYQVLRPPELFPLSRTMTAEIIASRLAFIPLLAGLAVFFARPVLRAMGERVDPPSSC